MLANNLYYILKPFVPRLLQIKLRTILVHRRLKSVEKIWPIDKRAAEKPAGWKGWPSGKKFALVLTHDVETKKGHDKCDKLIQLERDLGFRSSFNFVPKRYNISSDLRRYLTDNGFEVGVHGLYHDGKYYSSRKTFSERAIQINQFLKDWKSVGFRSPSMICNLDWLHELNIEYDSSTFDTDPFEPQPSGVGSIFPFWISNDNSNREGYTELPYTLPQDFTLFAIMGNKNIDIWKEKLDWLAEHGGMVLLNTHPDYMSFNGQECGLEEYPSAYYQELLAYIKSRYDGEYWHVLPKELASWFNNYRYVINRTSLNVESNVKQYYINKPIRVCMPAYTFYETDNRVKRYAEHLVQEGNDVDVIALRRAGQTSHEVMNGVHVYRVQRRSYNEKGKFSYLFRLFLFFIRSEVFLAIRSIKKSYNIIHVHNIPDFLVFSALLPKLRGSKVILDIHDIVPEYYVDKFKVSQKSYTYKALVWVEKMSISFSDHVIISNHLWEDKITSRSVNKGKCTTIMNYPDTNIFYKRLKKKDNDEFIFIYPGSLSWHQGLDIAIKALAIIKDQAPEAKLHIYGEGDTKKSLMDMVSQLGLRERVLFKESLPLDKIADVMSNADIGIVPKRANTFGNEAFSTKILEFMALGVPIIISRTRIDQFYFNDSLVTFFESDNEKDLSDKMLLLIKDRDLREKKIANSLEYIQKNSWNVKKHLYIDIVNSFLS